MPQGEDAGKGDETGGKEGELVVVASEDGGGEEGVEAHDGWLGVRSPVPATRI